MLSLEFFDPDCGKWRRQIMCYNLDELAVAWREYAKDYPDCMTSAWRIVHWIPGEIAAWGKLEQKQAQAA